MRRREGSSLVEVLIALGVLVGGLLVAYMLLQESFLGFRRLDKRQAAEAVSLNIQDRHFHTPASELMEDFGGPAGGRGKLWDDDLITSQLPLEKIAFKDAGFQMDAWAVGLDQGNGTTGLYFTTKVSWPVGNGKRQCVTHSRVVASGIHEGQVLMDLPEPSLTKLGTESTRGRIVPLAAATSVEEFGARASAVQSALSGRGRAAPIVFEGSQQVLARMSMDNPGAGAVPAPADGAASGAGPGGTADASPSRARGAGFAGWGSDTDDGSGRGPVASGGGWSGGGAGGRAASEGGGSTGGGGAGGGSGRRGGRSVGGSGATTDAQTPEGRGLAPNARAARELDGDGQAGEPSSRLIGGSAVEARPGAAGGEFGALEGRAGAFDGAAATPPSQDPLDFLIAAAPGLTREERQRLVPGKASSLEELEKLWAPLESRKVPPGIYRYTTVAYLHVTQNRVFRFEVLSLQADGDAERFRMISRRELTNGQVTGARMEGEDVLERRLVAVRALGPGGPSVPAGVTAICERAPERLYVSRPVIMPDGSVAPFGREIAVLAWDGAERGPEGRQGRGAREDIARRWALGEEVQRAGAAAGAGPAQGVAHGFDGGSYQERIATPRAGVSVVEEHAVTWASTRSRDAAYRAEVTAPSWKASEAFAKAVERMNAGDPAKALELVEGLRGQHPATNELDSLRATLLTQLDRWDDAATAFGELAQRPGVDASADNNLAFVELHRGNASAALQAAQRALDKDPAHLTASVNLGLANEMLGRREGARKAYQQGLAAHPDAASLVEGLRRVSE